MGRTGQGCAPSLSSLNHGPSVRDRSGRVLTKHQYTTRDLFRVRSVTKGQYISEESQEDFQGTGTRSVLTTLVRSEQVYRYGNGSVRRGKSVRRRKKRRGIVGEVQRRNHLEGPEG